MRLTSLWTCISMATNHRFQRKPSCPYFVCCVCGSFRESFIASTYKYSYHRGICKSIWFFHSSIFDFHHANCHCLYALNRCISLFEMQHAPTKPFVSWKTCFTSPFQNDKFGKCLEPRSLSRQFFGLTLYCTTCRRIKWLFIVSTNSTKSTILVRLVHVDIWLVDAWGWASVLVTLVWFWFNVALVWVWFRRSALKIHRWHVFAYGRDILVHGAGVSLIRIC